MKLVLRVYVIEPRVLNFIYEKNKISCLFLYKRKTKI